MAEQSNRPGQDAAEQPRPARVTPPAPGRPVATTDSPLTLRERLTALANRGTLLAIVGAVLVAVVGLVLYGAYDGFIKPRQQAAVRVGDREYDMTYFIRRFRHETSLPSQLGLSTAQLLGRPGQVGDSLVEEEIVIQRASTIGIGVSNNDLDKDLISRASAIATTDAEGNVQLTSNAEFAIRDLLKKSGLSLAELRRAVHGQRLVLEAKKHFEDEIPEQLPAAKVRTIVVADEVKAKDLKQQIDNGADFAKLAESNTLDTILRAQGGLREMTLQGLLPKGVDDVAFTLSAGKVSDPVRTDNDRWALVKLEEKTDKQDVGESQRTELGTKRYNTWLDQQKGHLGATNYLFSDSKRQNFVLSKSGVLERVRQQQQQRTPARPPAIPNFTITPPPAPNAGATPPPPPNAPPPAATAAAGGTP